ncbi:MAG TPA: hypothetical protein VE685_17810 [Thermoanaerobaculia bacterium]|nr:hypothetical protein [Thermoanaerobaculia bacterium]
MSARRCFLLLGLWVGGATLSGCATIAEGVATRLVNRELEEVEKEIAVVKGDLALFRKCLRGQGGVCPAATPAPVTAAPLQTRLAAPLSESVEALGPDHPAQAASEVLAHPLLDKVASLHANLTGVSSGPSAGLVKESTGSTGGAPESALTMSLSVEEVRDFTDRIGWATATGSWKALADHAEGQRADMTASASEAERKAVDREARRLAFLDAYLRAYFDNGRVVKVELQTADLEAKVDAYVKTRLPLFCGDASQAQTCAQIVADLREQILKGVAQDPTNKSYVLLPLGATGFVTRDGQRIIFPGFQIGLDPAGAEPVSIAKIDFAQVGADLVRVFLQAIFDADHALPAVSTATGVSLGKQNAGFDLQVFNPAVGNVDAKDFQAIAALSSQVEAAVGSAVLKAVGGLGPFSLNNEALEQVVATVIAMVVRDAVEQGAWCWYSCDLDGRIARAAHHEKDRIEEDLRRDAERLTLRLKLAR